MTDEEVKAMQALQVAIKQRKISFIPDQWEDARGRP